MENWFQHDFCMYPHVTSLHPTTWDQLLSDHLTFENFTKSPSDCENLQSLKTVKTNPGEVFSLFQPWSKRLFKSMEVSPGCFRFFRLQGPTPLHTSLAIFTSHQIEDHSNCPSPKWILVEKISRPLSKSRYRWTQMYWLMMFVWCFLMMFWCVTLDVFAEILCKLIYLFGKKAPHKSCTILQFLFIDRRIRWTNLRINFPWTSLCGFSCWSLERQTHNQKSAKVERTTGGRSMEGWYCLHVGRVLLQFCRLVKMPWQNDRGSLFTQDFW